MRNSVRQVFDVTAVYSFAIARKMTCCSLSRDPARARICHEAMISSPVLCANGLLILAPALVEVASELADRPSLVLYWLLPGLSPSRPAPATPGFAPGVLPAGHGSCAWLPAIAASTTSASASRSSRRSLAASRQTRNDHRSTDHRN